MYRPDGWRNCWNREREYDGMSSDAEIFEAGADAMLKALFEMAEKSPTGTFTFDSHVINIYQWRRNDRK